MEEVTELLKKKMSYEDIKRQLAKSGELMDKNVSSSGSEYVFGSKLIENGIQVIPHFKIGDYEFDFKVEKYPVILEVDGEFHEEERVREKDYIKWRYAIKRGFILVRFTDKEAHSLYAVEEVRKIIANCTKVPKEVWLYPYTILDWIKDKFNGIKRKKHD